MGLGYPRCEWRWIGAEFIEATVRASALPTLALTLVALTSLPAAASPYNSLVVFGDSLSDSGNAAALNFYDPNQVVSGNSYIPGAAYAPDKTFSNGLVWASDVAAAIGVTLQPSLLGGTNFAFGGATTGGPPPSLVFQASQYLAATGGMASPNALYVVEGGGNDARAGLPGGIASYLANIDTIVQGLKNAGAQHIVVWDTPNLALAPAVRGGAYGGISRRPCDGYERGSLHQFKWRSRRIDLRHLRSGRLDLQ
jgi:outer membrane lipase/esterase